MTCPNCLKDNYGLYDKCYPVAVVFPDGTFESTHERCSHCDYMW